MSVLRASGRCLASAVIALVALGCDPPDAAKPSTVARSGATATPQGGGHEVTGSPCRTAADCGTNETCKFLEAGCASSVRGICVGPQPVCAAAYPFCACTGRTVWACERPFEPFAHTGACPDGGAKR